MKSNHYIVALIFFLFAFSFCTQEKKEMAATAALGKNIKGQKDTSAGKCCASNIPARFSIKNANVPSR